MSKLALYTGLKTTLEAVNGVKTVRLWRNDLEREKIENPFKYPAVFIEFQPSDYRELTKGVQQYDMIVRLHICFESYKDEDTAILTLVESVFAKVHKKQYDYFGELLRVHEEQNFDHSNVQDYIQDYRTLGKDYAADKRATTEATVSPVITPVVLDPDEI